MHPSVPITLMNGTRMRLRAMLLTASLVPASLLAVAAADPADPSTCAAIDGGETEDASDDVLACQDVAYLSCSAAANGTVYSPLDAVPLQAAAPTESITDGAGCGKLETAQAAGASMTSLYDMNVNGFLVGNVDTLTVELHSIYAGRPRAGGEVNLEVRLVLGGASPTGYTTIAGTTGDIDSPVAFTVSVDPVASETALSESLVFTLTDIYEAFPELSKLGAGASNFQTLDLTVSVNRADWAGAFVMGTTEVPASVTLNGEVRGTVINTPFLVATGG